jgi:hypothetical protein
MALLATVCLLRAILHLAWLIVSWPFRYLAARLRRRK